MPNRLNHAEKLLIACRQVMAAATKEEVAQFKVLVDEALKSMKETTEARLTAIESNARDTMTMLNKTMENLGKILTDSNAAGQNAQHQMQEQIKQIAEKTDKIKEDVNVVQGRLESEGHTGKDKMKLNDLKTLQQTMVKYEGTHGSTGPGFPSWREDLETIIATAYPGLEQVLMDIRFHKQKINEDIYKELMEAKSLHTQLAVWNYKELSKEIYTLLRHTLRGRQNGCGKLRWRRARSL